MELPEPIRRERLGYGFMQGVMQKPSGPQGIGTRALIDIDELSTQLKVAKGTLYNWVYLRRIPFVKLGRALRFDPVEIARVLEASSTLEEVGRR
jgi:excisionase family DNA binding protein